MTLPSGTVTFLFTDIEGSTKLAEQYPDAMPAILAFTHQAGALTLLALMVFFIHSQESKRDRASTHGHGSLCILLSHGFMYLASRPPRYASAHVDGWGNIGTSSGDGQV
jgi:hypothetical protein